MNYEQKIRQYEERIARMEECRRISGVNQGEEDRNLNAVYEQFVLLKIRKMMGF